MVSKKKTGKSLGIEVAELSRFNEDFETAMREFKEQLEAKRLERQKAFKEYEKQYLKAKDDNYRILGIEFIRSLGLDNFGSLKELMNDEENKKALSAKKDFSVLFEKNDKFIRKVFSFIANDELVRTAVDEFIEEQKNKEEERLNFAGDKRNEKEVSEDVGADESSEAQASESIENGSFKSLSNESESENDKENVRYGVDFGAGVQSSDSGRADDEPVLL